MGALVAASVYLLAGLQVERGAPVPPALRCWVVNTGRLELLQVGVLRGGVLRSQATIPDRGDLEFKLVRLYALGSEGGALVGGSDLQRGVRMVLEGSRAPLRFKLLLFIGAREVVLGVWGR